MTRLALATLMLCACASEPEVEARVQRGADSDDPSKVDSEQALRVPASRGGQALVGQPAKPWGPLRWIGSEPISLEQLRGEVVLVRFWTDTCPFCAATAPALAQIHSDYADRGLKVLGFYHPKPRGSVRSLEAIEGRAVELGINFPIAVDEGWETLDAWWLSGGDQRATSVSFVLDRSGTIRFVHPGPEFSPQSERELFRRDHEQVLEAIEALLAEPIS